MKPLSFIKAPKGHLQLIVASEDTGDKLEFRLRLLADMGWRLNDIRRYDQATHKI